MVKMNAVDVQVLQVCCIRPYHLKTARLMSRQFQKTLTAYSASIQQQQQQSAGPSTAPAIQPASAIPPHLQQYRTPTPQSQTPPHVPSHTPTPPHYSSGHGQAPQQNFGYGAPAQYGVQGGYNVPQQAPMGGMIPDALASIPEEQKVRET
jgi:cleavage stimulation factor subunit 2